MSDEPINLGFRIVVMRGSANDDRERADLRVDKRARRMGGADGDAGRSGAGDDRVRLKALHREADDGTRRASEVAKGDAGKGREAGAKTAGKHAAALFDRRDADLQGVIDGSAEPDRPWFLTMLQKAGLVRLMRLGFAASGRTWNRTAGVAMQRSFALLGLRDGPMDRNTRVPRWVERVYDVLLVLIVGYVLYRLAMVVTINLGLAEVVHVVYLGLITAIRVLVQRLQAAKY